MNLCLEVAAGTVDLSDYEDEMKVAALVMALLDEGNDVVSLRPRDREGKAWTTQWTVLERNGYGRPVQIGYREFDGEMGVLIPDEAN